MILNYILLITTDQFGTMWMRLQSYVYQFLIESINFQLGTYDRSIEGIWLEPEDFAL